MRDASYYRFKFTGGIGRSGTFVRDRHDTEGRAQSTFSYFVNDSNLLHGRATPEIMDLLDVFLAISMCDRRAPRIRIQDGATPSARRRHTLEAVIPIRNPELWSRAPAVEAVHELGNLLNGAQWIFHVEPRLRDPRPVEMQRTLELSSALHSAIVLLQSGGLDSLLGIAKILAAKDDARVIPVSVFTNSRSVSLVQDINRSLRQVFPHASITGSHLQLEHLRKGQAIDDREREYRTRILPCFAAGIAVAAEFADGRLLLTENGPGAINLPTSPEQLDTWTTRATHPSMIELVARLATLVLEREVHIENTGQFQTKGELAMLLKDIRFQDAAGRTVSCERFPYSNADAPCGVCTSCLYRRMALQQADVAHIDAKRDKLIGRTAGPYVGQIALANFVEQLKRLLASENPYDMLAAQFRRIDEVVEASDYLGMPDDTIRASIVRLYREFVAEAEQFFKSGLASFPPREHRRAVAS